MRLLFALPIMFFCLAPSFGVGQKTPDTVKLVDSVHIYYFDLFDDKRAFDWGTVPKNFNFNNYRIYFKNNSDDTLIRGRVTTGDGKVRYGYAGKRQLILPGDYFVIKPIINTSLRYRIGRFGKVVTMTAMGQDSTYRFHHRYLGHFSKDTILPPAIPTKKLDEPLNPPLSKVEISNYQADQEKLRRLREYRKYKPISTYASDHPKNIHFDIKIYLSKNGEDIDSTAKIFYRRYSDQIELPWVSNPQGRSYFIFPNQDSVENAPIEVKFNGREHGFQRTINTVESKEIYLERQSKAPYLAIKKKHEIDDIKQQHQQKQKEVKEIKQIQLAEQKYPKKDMMFFMLDGKTRITEQCTAEVLIGDLKSYPLPADAKWLKMNQTQNEHGMSFFSHTFRMSENVKAIRWHTAEDSTWQYDKVFLKRQDVQSFLRYNDSVPYIYGHYGKTAVNWNYTRFRYQVEDKWLETNMRTYDDSVKRVLKWYGIPFRSVNRVFIELINEDDKNRVQRALNKHFEWAVLLPVFKGKYDDKWLCGSGRLIFSSGISQAAIKKMLTHPSIRSIYINDELIDGAWKVSVQFNEMMSQRYVDLLNKLFENENVLMLRTDHCETSRPD